MGIQVDDSGWPQVEVRWHGVITDAEVAEVLAHTDRWLARRQRFGLLLDSRGALGMTSAQRVQVVGYMRRRAPDTSRYLVQAIVIDNVITRTLLAAVQLIYPYPFPNRAFAEPGAARVWLASMLSSVPGAA